MVTLKTGLNELITIRELLRDPTFKKYFITVPSIPEHYTPDKLPWKLYVLKEHETVWRSKRFGTYKEAFDGLKKLMQAGGIINAAINNPALSFMPPIRHVRIKNKLDSRGKPVVKSLVWKPQLTDDMSPHHWCPYCRRPSIFKFAMPKPIKRGGFELPRGEPKLRCIICGSSESIVDLRNPLNAQQWDNNRPRIYNG